MKREGWIGLYLRTHRIRFVLVILLGLLTAVCASALMFTSGYLISKASLRPENILMVYVPVVLVRTFGIGRAVVHYTERLVGHDTVLRILSRMRVRLYRMLEPQALFIRSRYRTGDVLGTLADDIEHLQDVYVRTIFPVVTAVFMYILWVAFLGRFDLSFALVMALYLLILILILPSVSLWITYRKQRQMKRGRNRLYQKLTDAVLGLSDWVISGRSKKFVQSYEKDEVKVTSVENSLHRWIVFRTFLGQLFVGTLVVMTAWWAGQQFADGRLEGVLIAAYVLVIVPLMDVFLRISEAMERIPQYRESLDRINSLRDMDLAAQSTERKVSDKVLEEARKQAHIRLENVSYRYEASGEQSIRDLSLDIPYGKKIAVIGRSGAGKSTLLKLIQGAIVPEQGSVSINGIHVDQFGEDIPKVISVLNQRPHLFDTTVANNIRLGKPEATDEEISNVAKQVKLDRLIESLPLGYKTPMLETGDRFSGGERQRIALARILLQDTPVIILDEPTVGLDPGTERDLLRTIFSTIHGKTLIWITHHLVGVEQMDEIIFIEDGRIEMQGSHEELLEKSPRYRDLYHLDRPILTDI
ncbi:MAG: thiol reductant ABC exporter subunit CydC [Thermoactinomyces sp.]